MIDKILIDKKMSKNFLFFSFMSLNNKDVKDFKAKNLIGKKEIKNCLNFEIKDIICDKEFSSIKKNIYMQKLVRILEIIMNY